MTPPTEVSSTGKVSFVGAGPGDPGLITVKGLERLRGADVVVHYGTVDKRLLDQARPGAALVPLGEAGVPRDEVAALLLRLAGEGKAIVRLDDGDPFLFGDGAAEAEALASAGVEFEVVPGVPLATAVPTYAGIPVGDRELLVAVADDASLSEAGPDGGPDPLNGAPTIVCEFVLDLPRLAAALMARGYPPGTPIALISGDTSPQQATLTGRLDNIVSRAKEQRFPMFPLAVVGDVVARRERLRWFDNRPLFGKRVLVTRAKEQAGSLSELLAAHGAVPVELPTVSIQPLPDYAALDAAMERLASYDWAIFTSVNGVAYFFARLKTLRRDLRELKGVKLCAIGPATARALEERGLLVDYVPAEYVAEGVIAGLIERNVRGARILLPRAREAREVIVQDLTAAGATVEDIPVYQTVRSAESEPRARELFGQGAVDVVTLTSPSTARNMVTMLDGDGAVLANTTVACIGPVTADAARELGIHVDVVAAEHTIPGLVRAIVEFEKERRR